MSAPLPPPGTPGLPTMVHRVGRLPFLTIARGRLAITLPRYLVAGEAVVCINVRRIVAERGGVVPRELRAHEYAHVLQFRALGVWRFYWRYLREWRRHGYGPEMGLEREAMEYAREHARHPMFAPFTVGIR